MPNVLSGRFRTGSPRPLLTFAPGQCIPASAIMQFRRNVYEYSTKKLCPSLPYAKRTRTDFSGISDVATASVHSEKTHLKKMIMIIIFITSNKKNIY